MVLLRAVCHRILNTIVHLGETVLNPPGIAALGELIVQIERDFYVP